MDILGIIPGYGDYIDFIHGLKYLNDGDIFNAVCCFGSIIPLLGDGIAKGLKYSIKYLDDVGIMKKIIDASTTAVKKLNNKADDLWKAVYRTIDNEYGYIRKIGKQFKTQELLNKHYNKHGQEIAKVLGDTSYTIDKYLNDANYILYNGTYSSELNGYIMFMGGKNYGFVGLDRLTGDITTFHIKQVPELSKRAPGLGIRK